MKNTLLIVLFKSSIMDSLTINTLLNNSDTRIRKKIIIWNNGPTLLRQEDITSFDTICREKNITYFIYQDARNISLSKIYNFCIIKHDDFDFFTFLDQDSDLPNDFLSNIIDNHENDLICPQVYNIDDTCGQIYPIAEAERKIEEGIFNFNNIITIASGLSCSKLLLSRVYNKFEYIFNETFAFYYADTDFLLRLNQLVPIKAICIGKIYHSESVRLDKKLMPEHTKLELGYMKIIQRTMKRKKFGWIRNIRFCFRYKIENNCSYDTLFKMITVTITQRHPRSIFDITPNLKADYTNVK